MMMNCDEIVPQIKGPGYKSIVGKEVSPVEKPDSTISVLYVDDEPALLEICKLFLERSGNFHVATIDSAQKALEMLKIHSYDAIVSDYQMPVMDGIAFLKEVRSVCPTVPFIVFTGKGREAVAIEALNSGADHYLQKGGEPKSQFAELTHAITRSVQHRRANNTLLHLNNLYSVLSRTNRAVIRIRNRQGLLNEACRIAVEEGKFLMVWIGLVDPLTQTVHPVAACAIEDGYPGNLTVSIDNVPTCMGLTGTAIRENQTAISNDIASDPQMESYRVEVTKRGYRSSAAVPLNCRGGMQGAMQFYAAEVNFFNDGEIKLLEELVTDICFAMEQVDDKEE